MRPQIKTPIIIRPSKPITQARIIVRARALRSHAGCRACHNEECHSAVGGTAVTAPSSPNGATPRTRGSLMAVPNPTQDRHGVSINTELACRFPSATRAEQSFRTIVGFSAGRSPPAPHPQSPGVEPRLLQRLGFILLRAAAAHSRYNPTISVRPYP
jgi:hypothetical protein